MLASRELCRWTNSTASHFDHQEQGGPDPHPAPMGSVAKDCGWLAHRPSVFRYMDREPTVGRWMFERGSLFRLPDNETQTLRPTWIALRPARVVATIGDPFPHPLQTSA